MTDPSAATPVAAPPSTNEPMPPAQLATLVTATLGYYGLRDAVSTPWLRRAGQAVVLVGAVAPVVVGEFRSTPEETREEISANFAEAAATWRKQSVAKRVSNAVMVFGAVAGPVALTAWLTEKFDAVGESAVRKVGGRLPLVGALCRKAPNTVNGLLQAGVAVGVNTVLTSRQAGRTGNGKA